MIYTTYGTPITLLSPVSLLTGYVDVIADLGLNGFKRKTVNVVDLKADGGFNEIMKASDFWKSTLCVGDTKTIEMAQGKVTLAYHPDRQLKCRWSATIRTTTHLYSGEGATRREAMTQAKRQYRWLSEQGTDYEKNWNLYQRYKAVSGGI